MRILDERKSNGLVMVFVFLRQTGNHLLWNLCPLWRGHWLFGGFAALQKHVVYPEIARKAGIEGRVIINVLVNKSGQVDSVTVLKSLGESGCDQAAINAVKAVQWRPAQYKGEPVSVWVGMPVIFKLDKAIENND